jgi:hypothetical protein
MTTFTYKDSEFEYTLESDYGNGAPWEEHDGHGVVESRSGETKAPHEVVLDYDRNTYWFYDIKASTAVAKKDGWGLPEKAKQDLLNLINYRGAKRGEPARTELTQGEITSEAVRLDADYCRRYLAGAVTWVRLKVELPGTDKVEYLGGILYDERGPDDYLESLAVELAGQILSEVAQDEAELDLAMAGL